MIRWRRRRGTAVTTDGSSLTADLGTAGLVPSAATCAGVRDLTSRLVRAITGSAATAPRSADPDGGTGGGNGGTGGVTGTPPAGWTGSAPPRGPASNLVVSGLGLWCALAVLRVAARAATAADLDQALGVEASPAEREPADASDATGGQAGTAIGAGAGTAAELAAVDARLAELGGAAHALALWSALPLHPAFTDALPGVRCADLGDPAELDTWVAERTGGLIDRLPVTITPATVLALADAIALVAGWQCPFPEAATHPTTFHRVDGSPVEVPMMRRSFGRADAYRLARAGTAGTTLLFDLVCAAGGDELGADGRWLDPPRAHLRLALPAPGLGPDAALADLLDGSSRPVTADRVDVVLPRFALRAELDLTGVLPALGLERLLGPDADLGAMADGPLAVEAVAQAAVIEVDEAGVQAAAVTAIAVQRSAAPPVREIVELRFDRPFAFALVDPALDLPLFAGWVADPST